MNAQNISTLNFCPLKISLSGRSGMILFKSLVVLFFYLFAIQGFAQSQSLRDYVIIGGDQNSPSGSTNGVFIGPNNVVDTGMIGSYSWLQASGNLMHGGGMYSVGQIDLSGSNDIGSNIYSANASANSGNIFTTGSGFLLHGSLYVGGDVNINSGNILGSVTRPASSTFIGPIPAQGETLANYNFNALPAYPQISVFPSMGNGKLASL